MPRRPTIYHSPLKTAFVCAKCNRNFRSRAGRTRHVNAKHSGQWANSPQSVEGDNSSEVENSSCPGSPSLALPNHISDAPSPDTFDRINTFDSGDNNANLDHDFGENNPNFNNDDIDMPQTPPLLPSQDTTFTEYHPYLNGKMIIYYFIRSV